MFSWYDQVQKIKSWIDRNIKENISLLQLSNYIGYSPYYLSRKFNELEGISLKEYILVSKIQHSALQLLENNNRIIDISIQILIEKGKTLLINKL